MANGTYTWGCIVRACTRNEPARAIAIPLLDSRSLRSDRCRCCKRNALDAKRRCVVRYPALPDSISLVARLPDGLCEAFPGADGFVMTALRWHLPRGFSGPFVDESKTTTQERWGGRYRRRFLLVAQWAITKPTSTSLRVAFPASFSTRVSANSIAVPAPREVTMLPSTTTGSSR